MRLWLFIVLLLLAMLLLFLAAQAMQLPFLAEDTAFLLQQQKGTAAALGVGLLLIDVVAPVPSSVVMLANGMLFGVVLGTALSMVGGGGAAAIGFWLGRSGGRAGRRWFGVEALNRANAFFQKHGMMAVILSRPVPILAETVTVVAGISGMRAGTFFSAALLGLLPTALIYGLAGAYALALDSGLYVFLAVMALAGVTWAVGLRGRTTR